MFLPFVVLGQQAKIVFNTTSYDFGKIEERQGKGSYHFAFTNKGDAPLVIRHVDISCGCITAHWNRKPVMPGERGLITITYDPKRQTGKFSKAVIVNTNSGGAFNIRLHVSGEVVHSLVDTPKEHPFTIGSLLLESDTIYWDTSDQESRPFRLTNRGNTPRSISVSKPDYLDVYCNPLSLLPNTQGHLIIRPSPGKNTPDSFRVPLYIRTDEGKEGKIIIIRKAGAPRMSEK